MVVTTNSLAESLTVAGYRSITVRELSAGNYKTVVYSQGLTTAVASIAGTQNIWNSRRKTGVVYSVSPIADRINWEAQRKSRRHTEIQLFLDSVYSAINCFLPLTRPIIHLAVTDGSSRTCALNAGAVSILTNLATSAVPRIPVGISFGYYNEKLVYDLNYVEDSGGTADSALGGTYSDTEGIRLYSILYEGQLAINIYIYRA